MQLFTWGGGNVTTYTTMPTLINAAACLGPDVAGRAVSDSRFVSWNHQVYLGSIHPMSNTHSLKAISPVNHLGNAFLHGVH